MEDIKIFIEISFVLSAYVAVIGCVLELVIKGVRAVWKSFRSKPGDGQDPQPVEEKVDVNYRMMPNQVIESRKDDRSAMVACADGASEIRSLNGSAMVKRMVSFGKNMRRVAAMF